MITSLSSFYSLSRAYVGFSGFGLPSVSFPHFEQSSHELAG
jgi:hypothetical protein